MSDADDLGEPMTDYELLAEWRGKREWLRGNPSGAGAAVTRRRLEELEREIHERALDLKESGPLSSATIWWVTASGVGRFRHNDRECLHLSDSVVREAAEAELRLPICSTCG